MRLVETGSRPSRLEVRDWTFLESKEALQIFQEDRQMIASTRFKSLFSPLRVTSKAGVAGPLDWGVDSVKEQTLPISGTSCNRGELAEGLKQ